MFDYYSINSNKNIILGCKSLRLMLQSSPSRCDGNFSALVTKLSSHIFVKNDIFGSKFCNELLLMLLKLSSSKCCITCQEYQLHVSVKDLLAFLNIFLIPPC